MSNKKLSSAIHLYLNGFFKYKVGNEIVSLAKEYNSYLVLINNTLVYINYHMKGKYTKRTLYSYATLCIFLQTESFRKLIICTKEILEKYNRKEVDKEKP